MDSRMSERLKKILVMINLFNLNGSNYTLNFGKQMVKIYRRSLGLELKKKKRPESPFLLNIWRSGRDSNPRPPA